MAARRPKNKNTTSDGYAYLTKRTLVSKAQTAGKIAEDKAMDTMGYIVVVIENAVVKKYADGHIEHISQVME